MTVNAWSIGHHRTYDKTKTAEEQWQWLIELNDTEAQEGVTLTPHRLLTIVADVIENEPLAIDEADLRCLALLIQSAIEEHVPGERRRWT